MAFCRFFASFLAGKKTKCVNLSFRYYKAEAIKTNPAFAGKLLTKALFSDKKYFKASKIPIKNSILRQIIKKVFLQ